MKDELLKKIVDEAIQKTGGPIAALEREKQKRFSAAIDAVGGRPKDEERLEEQGDEEEEAEAPAEDEAPAGEEGEEGEAGEEGAAGEEGGDEDLESLFGAGGGGGGAPPAGGPPPGEEGEGAPEGEEPEEEEPEAPKKPRGQPIRKVPTKVKVNVDDVALSLNTIRSGKSLRDPKVRNRLNDYYKSLDHVEKIALHKMLRGLAQVIVGGVPGEKASEPSDDPKPIHMTLPGEDEEVSPRRKREKDASYVEDTKPPVRVVPGTNESVEIEIRRAIRKILG